jgi:hypothetical protein
MKMIQLRRDFMFLEKLVCSNCKKEIDKSENITIKTNSKNLKGYALLSSWAKIQKVYCEKCSQ